MWRTMEVNGVFDGFIVVKISVGKILFKWEVFEEIGRRNKNNVLFLFAKVFSRHQNKCLLSEVVTANEKQSKTIKEYNL